MAMGAEMDDVLSIQERLYPHLTCFGCGHANSRGLKLRSYLRGGFVEARFTPWPEHDNGFGFLNGGIIATLLDCHSAAAVYLAADAAGPGPGEGGAETLVTQDSSRDTLVAGADGGARGDRMSHALFVTARLDVRYLRPAPLHDEVALRAAVMTADGRSVRVDAQLVWEGAVRSEARSEWRAWRPRTTGAG